jgi:hypothetical protein
MACPYRLLPFACAAGLFAGATSALAQTLPPEAKNPAVQAAAAACSGDIQKYCATITPGGGRIVRCLAGQRDNLTPACRDGILKAKTALGR